MGVAAAGPEAWAQPMAGGPWIPDRVLDLAQRGRAREISRATQSVAEVAVETGSAAVGGDSEVSPGPIGFVASADIGLLRCPDC